MTKTLQTKLKKSLSKIDFWVAAILVVSILVLFVNVIAVQNKRAYTSDDVVTQTMIHDFRTSGGEGRLWFGEDNFVIKIPFYLLLDFFLVNSRHVITGTVIIFDIAGFVLFFCSALYFLKRFKVQDRWVLLSIVWLASCYNVAYYFLMNPNLRNVEIGINFVVLALLAKYIDGDFTFDTWIKKVLVLALIGLLGLFFYSDPFFTYMLGIPLLAFFAWYFIWHKTVRTRAAYAFGFVVASIVSTFFWTKFFSRFFSFSLKRASTEFATASEMLSSAKQLAWNYFYLYFADFWNYSSSMFTTFRSFLNFVIAVLSLIIPMYILIRAWRKKKAIDPWLLFMLGMPLFVGAIFILSKNSIASGFPAIRFLVLMPFYVIFAFALIGRETINNQLKKIIFGILALAILCNFASLFKIAFIDTATNKNTNNMIVVDSLRQNNLIKGYGHNWDTSINSYLSNNQLKIIRMECFAKIYWLTNDGNEGIPASQTFYIYNAKYSQACTKQQVHERFGEPLKQIPVDEDITIFIYDYDIGNRFDLIIPK